MRLPLLLVCVLTISACSGRSLTPSGDLMPRAGDPPEGPEIPALCSPTCAAGLEKLQQCWLSMLTESAQAAENAKRLGQDSCSEDLHQKGNAE